MPSPSELRDLVAISASMRRVTELVARAAASDVAVLVLGEEGTGKTRIARTIHAQSARRDAELVAVDGGSIDETELFAAVRASSKGTLFVRDVALVDRALQLKLFVSAEKKEEGRPAFRLVVATGKGRSSGRFRSDLHRRNALVIELPPLRERPLDILPLARAFLASVRPGTTPRLTPETEHALEAHDWPGNVRELEDVIARALAVTTGDVITVDALPRTVSRRGVDLPRELTALPYREMLAASRQRVSSAYFTVLLEEASGNVTQAAARAGLERESLHRLLKRFGLNAESFRPK